MLKEKKSITSSLDPILEINEFEEEQVATLDLAQKESSRIIQEAKVEADNIIRRVKEAFPNLEKEAQDKIEEELNLEKEKLVSQTKEELQRLQNIAEERIHEAVRYVLDKLCPK